jgi:hypothetical protein
MIDPSQTGSTHYSPNEVWLAREKIVVGLDFHQNAPRVVAHAGLPTQERPMTIGTQIKEQSAALARKTGEEIRKHPIATAAIAVAAMGLISYLATQAWRATHNSRSH